MRHQVTKWTRALARLGLTGAILACGFVQVPLQAAQEPRKQPERVTDDVLRSMSTELAKAKGGVESKERVDAAPDKAEERVVKQEIVGEVVATTKRSLSLETGRTANTIEEILLPVDPAVTTFERVTSVTDLQRGDRVRVEYRQTFHETGEDEDEERLVATVATKISLVGHAIGGQALRSTEGDGR